MKNLSRLWTGCDLDELPGHCEAILQLIGQNKGEDDSCLVDALEKSASAAKLLSYRLSALAELANTMFQSMEFGFLFDSDRQLLSIGYRRATARSIPISTTCWRRRRGSPVSSPSPKAICRPSTGSGLDAR